jgi:predicted nucleic acid-binding Zn ribbon protein
MVKKDAQIERIGDVLEKSLKRFAPTMRLDEYGVWPVWNDVVGKAIARNAQPEKIRNGTLFVKVASPVWMQQLQYMKEMIAEKLNARLKTEVVKNIFFVVGRVSAEALEEESKSPPQKQSESSECTIDAAFVESIKDPEIKQAFKKLLKSYSRRKRGHCDDHE